MDAHGGWLASAPDLLDFLLAVDGRTSRPDLLQEATTDLMVARPPLAEYQGAADVLCPRLAGPADGRRRQLVAHGSLPGTSTIMVRTANDMSWVALFNSRPAAADAFFGELDSELWRAVNGITDWPAAAAAGR